MRNGETPSRAMSHPLVNRRLDFSMEEPRQSIERSPKKTRSVASSSSSVVRRGKPQQLSEKGRKRPFDLSMTDEEEEEDFSGNLHGDDTQSLNDNDLGQALGHQEDGTASAQIEDESLPLVQEESSEMLPDMLQKTDNLQERVEPPQKKKRGRVAKTKTAAPEKQATPTADVDGLNISANSLAAKRRGRPAKKKSVDLEAPEIGQGDSHVIELIKGRGRKKGKEEVRTEDQQEAVVGREKPAKRARHTSVQRTPTKAGRKVKKPGLTELDPNVPIANGIGRGKTFSAEPVPLSTALGNPKSRSLYILRHETPAEDDGSRLLRSGRTSVRPIAFWRGERIVYGESNIDGKNVVLPAIKEVIRTEEVVDSKPKKIYRRGNGPGRARLYDVEEEDEDEDAEAWEQEPGVLRAEVLQWDPVTQRGIDDNVEDVGSYRSCRAHFFPMLTVGCRACSCTCGSASVNA